MRSIIKPFMLKNRTPDGDCAKVRVFVEDNSPDVPVVIINKRVLSKTNYTIGDIIYTYNGYKLYEFGISFRLTTLNDIMFVINQHIAKILKIK